MKLMPNLVRKRIAESLLLSNSLRSTFRVNQGSYFSKQPAFDRTTINYDLARQLYRNDGDQWKLGSGFCKPIVDSCVSFIGIPVASTADEEQDDFINRSISQYWAEEIQNMFRNALRDSRTIVRVRKPSLFDPFVEREDLKQSFLEIIDPDRADLFYDAQSGVIVEAIITHKIDMKIDERETNYNTQVYQIPKTKVHTIYEIITPNGFKYYDKTEEQYLPDWEQSNPWGFVPLVEIFNEFDTTLSGGQSEFESPLPFIRAFHDVLVQSLQAHKYHSIPKAKFKINDVTSFLRNNFPDSFDETTGKFTGSVNWSGKEIIFLQSEEDVEFVEAESVLGDSKSLLDFLFDCICISSETPAWAFMRTEGVAEAKSNAQTMPFMKKIERKRNMFRPYIQRLVKMLLVINGQKPLTASISWNIIQTDEFSALTQGIQQLIMALEVAAQRKVISDRTYRETIREYLPKMKSPSEEEKDAKENFVPLMDMPALPISSANGGGQNE